LHLHRASFLLRLSPARDDRVRCSGQARLRAPHKLLIAAAMPPSFGQWRPAALQHRSRRRNFGNHDTTYCASGAE
jgi:hypothetical protein